jgi:hypothetical protein
MSIGEEHVMTPGHYTSPLRQEAHQEATRKFEVVGNMATYREVHIYDESIAYA